MVGIIDEAQLFYPLGTRIKIGNNYGTVKYVGEVCGHAGTWLGIEWDEGMRGKHNGIVDGKRYFQTQLPTAGSFIRPGKLGPCATLEDEARERYLNYDSSNVDVSLIREAQASVQASLFEVVGMDKIARKQSKFEQLSEVSVDETPVNAAGYLKDLTQLTTLNVSHTLIWNWQIVASITEQLPMLNNLNLSSNRLVLPTEAEISKLEPAFRQLRHINLRNCGFTDWKDVMQTALLWPDIESLGLQENSLSQLLEVDCNRIFRQLRELDLHRTKLMDFDQVCKLGNIATLRLLNLMENGIEQLQLPDCEPHSKLNLFVAMEQLNLLHNPIWNEAEAFNELDKLPQLKRINMSPHLKSNFDEMFSKAVASIGGLQFVNKAKVTAEERRGAEYDIWKKHAVDWLQASKLGADALREFYKKHRTYLMIVNKYGSPADFVPRIQTKQSNLIKVRIQHQPSGEIWEKKVPRMITVQTLQGLVMKRFRLSGDTPQLCYVDAKHPELVVPLENNAKTLDFYSVQEHDTVLVQ
ncbi:tubulin-specific chaperone E [Drosophila nasuta]|uniref:Tubulin-specific chaperone E n=1 Tax=Drosophila albomicans TaxID=7291 RepID=A0A6P8XAZ7_DROAB|nr:tubulin-specific chaperone E [Drosophila albomicans]XP_060651315.1 tubulin-specific chaperone E [Drosophila nasuta]